MNWLFSVCVLIVIILVFLSFRTKTAPNVVKLQPSGAACGRGDDCITNACNNGICANPGDVNTACGAQNKCNQGLTCVIGKCLPPQPSGANCAVDTDCAIGACNNKLCANPGDVGTSCASAPCNSGLFCVNKICSSSALGEQCDINNQCPSPYHCTGYCTKSTSPENFL